MPSGGKGKGQFTSQGWSAVELDLKIQVRRHCHRLRSPPLSPRPPHLNYHMAFRCLKTHQNSFSPNSALCTLNSNKIELKWRQNGKCCMTHLRCVIVIKNNLNDVVLHTNCPDRVYLKYFSQKNTRFVVVFLTAKMACLSIDHR